MNFSVCGQELADVQQLELEDGLLDRIVNKVHRDTFGYFYLFFDQGIQQYDGKNFRNVGSVQLNSIDLASVSHVNTNLKGGISFQIDNKVFNIPPGTTKAILSTIPAKPGNTQEYIESFKVNGKNYFAVDGTIWHSKNKIKENISVDPIPNLRCHQLKRDKYGNCIALFGQSPRTIERILVIRVNGEVEDYSSLLDYNNNIRDIYTDDIDSKWLVATFNGILIFNFSDDGIDSFHVYENLKKSEFGNIITSVNTETGKVIFLKESHGLRQLDENGEVKLLFENYPNYFHQNQTMIFDEYQQSFYSYSYNSTGEFDLYKFNLEKETVELDLIPLRIRDMYNLDSEHLLLGGHTIYEERNNKSGQLSRYNKNTKQLERILKDIPAIRCIKYIESTKEFWLGTQYGIFIYDRNFKLKENITSDVNSEAKYLSHPEIRTMLEFHEYVIVGSYNGGIYIIDKKTKEIVKNITEANDLSDNAIAGLIRDNNDNLWIATFNGLTVLNDKFEIISKIYEYNGLPNREFNTKAISKDENGILYFGTLNGLVRIDPVKLLQKVNSNGLHLRRLEVFTNNTSQKFDELNKPIKFYSNYDSLSLDIAFPDYYTYRFDDWTNSFNIDGDLKDVSRFKNEKLMISQIPTGDYSFSFSNKTSPFSEKLELEITRDNRNIILAIVLILSMLFLSYLFFKYRIKQLKKFEKEKTRINTKIAELELTALRSQMNPHFIFNALGSVQYFIQTQETEKADSYLSNFAKLMRNILESSKSKYISLTEEVKLLRLYVGLEKMRFEKLFDFEINIDPEIDEENPVPPMIIQPFLENAINHGLYHLTKREGKLSLEFKHINELEMECIISDNGIGREAAGKLRKPNHKSRGLEIVKDRIQTINSQAEVKIHIKTEDLKELQEATGTKVIINFKYDE